MQKTASSSADLSFGRIVVGTLAREVDVQRYLAEFCRRHQIRGGLFSLTGTTRSAIFGTYDPDQQVYATRRETGALQIVHCAGTILPEADRTAVAGHILLCNEKGVLTGGRLFSDTPVDAGEFEIRELLGALPERVFDRDAARFGLRFA